MASAVTLLIPTWNAGPEFPEILGAMRDQRLDRSLEILVIDSGSLDGSRRGAEGPVSRESRRVRRPVAAREARARRLRQRELERAPADRPRDPISRAPLRGGPRLGLPNAARWVPDRLRATLPRDPLPQPLDMVRVQARLSRSPEPASPFRRAHDSPLEGPRVVQRGGRRPSVPCRRRGSVAPTRRAPPLVDAHDPIQLYPEPRPVPRGAIRCEIRERTEALPKPRSSSRPWRLTSRGHGASTATHARGGLDASDVPSVSPVVRISARLQRVGNPLKFLGA